MDTATATQAPAQAAAQAIAQSAAQTLLAAELDRTLRAGRQARQLVARLTVLTAILAGLTVAVLIMAWVFSTGGPGGHRDRFASRRAQELYATSKKLFEDGNNTYSAFKTQASGADPVLYQDLRGLWRGGKLTPESVEKVL